VEVTYQKVASFVGGHQCGGDVAESCEHVGVTNVEEMTYQKVVCSNHFGVTNVEVMYQKVESFVGGHQCGGDISESCVVR
jgi:hypothetical protein